MDLYNTYKKVCGEIAYSTPEIEDWDNLPDDMKDAWEAQVICIKKIYLKIKTKLKDQKEILTVLLDLVMNKIIQCDNGVGGVGMLTNIDVWRMAYTDYFELKYMHTHNSEPFPNMYL